MAIAAEEILIQKLPKNVLAYVSRVVGSHDEVARMAELGIHDGASIMVVRQGSPCIVMVNSSRICVRSSSELSVFVTPRS